MMYIYCSTETNSVSLFIINKGKYMTLIIELVVAAVAGFIFGILFGRRNTKKIETDITDIKAAVSKLTGGKL